MKKLLNTALAIDFEFDNHVQENRIIEIGLTEVNLTTLEIGTTYDLFPELKFDVDPRIEQLIGLTSARIRRRQITWRECCKRLHRYGIQNRMLIVDDDGEPELMKGFYNTQVKNLFEPTWPGLYGKVSNLNINISVLYRLITGKNESVTLLEMLKEFGLEFEGRQHRANDDSRNIARVFCSMAKTIRGVSKW